MGLKKKKKERNSPTAPALFPLYSATRIPHPRGPSPISRTTACYALPPPERARKCCELKDHPGGPELSIDLADLLMVFLLHGKFQRDYMEEMKELPNEAASFLPPNHPRRLEQFYTILASDMFQLAFLDRSVDCVTNMIDTTRVVINELSASCTHSPSPAISCYRSCSIRATNLLATMILSRRHKKA